MFPQFSRTEHRPSKRLLIPIKWVENGQKATKNGGSEGVLPPTQEKIHPKYTQADNVTPLGQ